ncbi:AraC family transcriptional regulator [Mycolicibacterium iranicum]|uniref:HTH araC/xylS-type domain-containing protein n=1 Tax=Mycolicibacterium iranicum TaxID=912594 RepID=A0A178LYX8_MYCIR|nr:AraC family transcriptional regulator [Mycolicibacterium iranicum]OAN38925.1 hypothetical protein A4X20_19295 [Mycolicibacterium iranicum]
MHSIRATCLLQYRELVTELDFDPDPILAAAGVRPDDAGRPDRFIELRAAIQTIESTAEITGTPDFGRRLAARRGIETLGPVGVAAQSAATFADALNIFTGFIGAHSPGLALTLRPLGNSQYTAMELRFMLDPPPQSRQSIELYLMAALQIFRSLLGSHYSPLAAQFPHSALTERARYIRDFGCTCHFSRPVAGFTLRVTDLRRPLRTSGQADHAALDHVRSLTPVRPAAMALSVAELIRALLPTGAPSLGPVATHFDLHPRTLQRRLSADGTSFEAIVDKVRRETAEHYLRDTDVSLDQLAHLLGYSEQSVLTRACNRWFGRTPSEYRRGDRAGST